MRSVSIIAATIVLLSTATAAISTPRLRGTPEGLAHGKSNCPNIMRAAVLKDLVIGNDVVSVAMLSQLGTELADAGISPQGVAAHLQNLENLIKNIYGHKVAHRTIEMLARALVGEHGQIDVLMCTLGKGCQFNPDAFGFGNGARLYVSNIKTRGAWLSLEQVDGMIHINEAADLFAASIRHEVMFLLKPIEPDLTSAGLVQLGSFYGQFFLNITNLSNEFQFADWIIANIMLSRAGFETDALFKKYVVIRKDHVAVDKDFLAAFSYSRTNAVYNLVYRTYLEGAFLNSEANRAHNGKAVAELLATARKNSMKEFQSILGEDGIRHIGLTEENMLTLGENWGVQMDETIQRSVPYLNIQRSP